MPARGPVAQRLGVFGWKTRPSLLNHALKHGPLPPAQDGRDHEPAIGRRQEALSDDDRTRGRRHRLTIALSKSNKAP